MPRQATRTRAPNGRRYRPTDSCSRTSSHPTAHRTPRRQGALDESPLGAAVRRKRTRRNGRPAGQRRHVPRGHRHSSFRLHDTRGIRPKRTPAGDVCDTHGRRHCRDGGRLIRGKGRRLPPPGDDHQPVPDQSRQTDAHTRANCAPAPASTQEGGPGTGPSRPRALDTRRGHDVPQRTRHPRRGPHLGPRLHQPTRPPKQPSGWQEPDITEEDRAAVALAYHNHRFGHPPNRANGLTTTERDIETARDGRSRPHGWQANRTPGTNGP